MTSSLWSSRPSPEAFLILSSWVNRIAYVFVQESALQTAVKSPLGKDASEDETG